MGAYGWVCSLVYAVHQVLSLSPCTVMVLCAPGHNRWGVVERRLPVKTQGRTLDCPFNFRPPRFSAGWLSSVKRLRRCGQSPRYRRRTRTAVTSVVTGQTQMSGVIRHLVSIPKIGRD